MTSRHAPERLARFLAKIAVDESTGCWLWTAARKPNGYAQFSKWLNPGSNYAHRWAYEHFVGPIPLGMHIDHTCNRGRDGCVNPEHLEAVTQAENNRRMRERLGLDGDTCTKGHVGEFQRRARGVRSGEVVYCKACRRENHAATDHRNQLRRARRAAAKAAR